MKKWKKNVLHWMRMVWRLTNESSYLTTQPQVKRTIVPPLRNGTMSPQRIILKNYNITWALWISIWKKMHLGDFICYWTLIPSFVTVTQEQVTSIFPAMCTQHIHIHMPMPLCAHPHPISKCSVFSFSFSSPHLSTHSASARTCNASMCQHVCMLCPFSFQQVFFLFTLLYISGNLAMWLFLPQKIY